MADAVVAKIIAPHEGVNDLGHESIALSLVLIMPPCIHEPSDLWKDAALSAPHASQHAAVMGRMITHDVILFARFDPFLNGRLLSQIQSGIDISHDEALDRWISRNPKPPISAIHRAKVLADHNDFTATLL